MKNELTSVRHIHSRPKEDYLYLGAEYVGRIRSDLTKELCDLWAEAHIEETVAQRVGRRLNAGSGSQVELKHAEEELLDNLEGAAAAISLTLAELVAKEEPKI